jgi:hypothetical protein
MLKQLFGLGELGIALLGIVIVLVAVAVTAYIWWAVGVLMLVSIVLFFTGIAFVAMKRMKVGLLFMALAAVVFLFSYLTGI